MTRSVFMTGGTGFIGRALTAALLERGDRVILLTRDVERARQKLSGLADKSRLELVQGEPTYGDDCLGQLAGAHAVVNLAGQGVADRRWSAHYKQLLHDSRVETTRYLVEAMAALEPDERPRVLASASGIDYYPFSEDLGAHLAVDDDDEVDERAPPGDTFLARLCRNWEAEALTAETVGVRVVLMRTGVVLGRGGGALAQMERPFRFFAGGRVGNGRQWFSWVHLDDAVRAYLFALDHESVSGPLNLVAPEPVRAADFSRALGRAMGRPSWLPVPAFAVRAAVGEFAEHLLHGRRAVPRALAAHGFEFTHPDLAGALRQIYRDRAA